MDNVVGNWTAWVAERETELQEIEAILAVKDLLMEAFETDDD